MSGLIPLPVLHGRLEFAVAVRQALEAVRPDCIAVELPETLRRPVLAAVRRLPLLSVVAHQDSQGGWVYLPIEPADPLIEALRFGLEREIPVHLVDQDVEGYGRHHDLLPDAYALRRLGHQAFCRACQDVLARVPPDPQDQSREAVMAFGLAGLLEQHQRVAFVCGISHAQRVAQLLTQPPTSEPLRRVRRDSVTLYHLAEESSKEVLSEPPYLSLAFEHAREQGGAALDQLDRLTLQVQLAQQTRQQHRKERGEDVAASALHVLFRFARNYALVEGRLAPDLYQLLAAARGAVDDNFAYQLWELATRWPYQTDQPGLPVLRLSLEDLYQHTRSMRFHRTLQRRRRLLRVVKDRPREAYPGQWREAWNGDAICSFPPEDLVVESYGVFLRHKAKGLLSAEQTRTEPFASSLLDGIDVKETVRNWHEGRLYVREQQQVRGSVGAVVLVFDEDRDPGQRYPWTVTWQGEHEQESDMAFYATPIGDKIVGPGISRCEYGGFVLTHPPGRMFQVFEDPLFDLAESKPERLLLAALDYSLEKIVVYAGPRPPRSRFRSLAERFGKRLVYIPLGDLSPVSLKQMRTFHVLAGHQVREHAADYIF